jgi:hypothetical protein
MDRWWLPCIAAFGAPLCNFDLSALEAHSDIESLGANLTQFNGEDI